MFFISGVAKRDLTVDTDYELVQLSRLTEERLTFRTTSVSIVNFEAGTRLSEGEEFQGVIATLSQGIVLRAPFDVRFGEFSIQFALSGEAVDRLEQ